MPPQQQYRGVSLGGWLVFESFITPYLFSLTDCDINGDFYDIEIGNINSPKWGGNRNTILSKSRVTKHCSPLKNYPKDMWTLASAFPNKEMAKSYFSRHWDTWVTEEDIASIAKAGLTHVKIPVGHWIMGDIRGDEPWIDGDWPYLLRCLLWCRKYQLEVILDIHTAPGSQNGFDNSGRMGTKATALGWSSKPENIKRSLLVIEELSKAIAAERLENVVTGIEILNEIYGDADPAVVKNFYGDAFSIIRNVLGNETTVVVSDFFDAGQFNGFWSDPKIYENTLLDSHFYSVFSEKLRSMSPKQHVAFICGHYARELERCCWENEQRSKGIGRIVGEWTASYDSLVSTQINDVFEYIRKLGLAKNLARKISKNEKKFLRNFVETQMVVYEGGSIGQEASNGWFYWNFKMEGGEFAEWDYTRGVKEGWVPILERDESSVQRFGNCEKLILRTKEDDSIIQEYPDPSVLPPSQREDRHFDDDIVMTHGESLEKKHLKEQMKTNIIFAVVWLVFLTVLACRLRRKRKSYNSLPEVDFHTLVF